MAAWRRPLAGGRSKRTCLQNRAARQRTLDAQLLCGRVAAQRAAALVVTVPPPWNAALLHAVTILLRQSGGHSTESRARVCSPVGLGRDRRVIEGRGAELVRDPDCRGHAAGNRTAQHPAAPVDSGSAGPVPLDLLVQRQRQHSKRDPANWSGSDVAEVLALARSAATQLTADRVGKPIRPAWVTQAWVNVNEPGNSTIASHYAGSV